jgi:hypothetical protein
LEGLMTPIGSRLLAIAASVILPPAMVASDRLEVPYPEGYRHWTHIKSAYVGKASPAFRRFGGLHNIYANARAMEGYRNGRFPVGSVLVFDVLEASSSDQGVEPGSRKFVDVMWKSADGRDGRWVFGEFDRDSRTTRNVTAEQGVVQCQACHDGPAATDGVFSKFAP